MDLSRFADVADRIAVVDTETTGVYPSDRIVEIAVVTLDLQGRVIDEWDTLVNPERDVGPTWIHGVTPSMLTHAPTFGEIAGELAARINGAIVSAHNLPFDTRMLFHEFERHDVEVAFGFGFDTLALTRCKLGVACEDNGISLNGAHQALTDARATAQLLLRIEAGFDNARAASVSSPLRTTGRTGQCRRDAASQLRIAPPSYLAELASRLDHVTGSAEIAVYLDLLDRAMADLHLDDQERKLLRELAHDIGLDDVGIRQAHDLWVRDLTAAAAEDGVVDAEEYDQLLRAAHVLEIDAGSIDRRTAAERTATVEIKLEPGTSVCFTGAVVDEAGRETQREALEAHARSLGLTVEDSFTKSRCDLLIAADPATTSSKAVKARRWGLPIVSAADLFLAQAGATVRGYEVVVGGSTAHTCGQCGRAFTTDKPRAPKDPRCATCGPPSRPERKAKLDVDGPLSGRRLWCSPNCGDDVRSLIEFAGGAVGKSLSKTVYAVVVASGDEQVSQVLRAEALDLVVVSEDRAKEEINAQLALRNDQTDQAAEPAMVRSTVKAPTDPRSSPAKWHADPVGEATWRWWDGRAWTNHTAP